MKDSRWKQILAGKMRRAVKVVIRRQYLAITAVALAAALALTIAPRGLASAASTGAASPAASPSPAPASGAKANDDGVTWDPTGSPTQTNDGTGDCEVDMSGTVSGNDPAIINTLTSVMDEESVAGVNEDGINSLAVNASRGNGTSDTLQVRAGASISCSLENQTDAYVKKAGYRSLRQFTQAVLDASLHPAPVGSPRRASQRAELLAYDADPAWLRGAIAAITGGIIFAVVSAITTATLVAFGAATGPAGILASAELATFTGCFAGAISTKLSSAIAGDNNGILSGVGPLIVGCFTGGALQYLRAAVPWLSAMLTQAFVRSIAAILGTPIANNALRAQVELPLRAAWDQAQQALPEP